MTLLGDLMYHPAVFRSRRREETNKELSFILRGRGFAHSSVDPLHPLPERPEESLPRSYIDTVQNALNNFTPDTSGQSSPTTGNTPSIANGLSDSHTWSTNTGIHTGRSTCSVNSWGNEDEFDRQASATVKRMFDEIDGMLFEGKPFNGTVQLLSECEEWFQQFPHLRICGHQLLVSKDDGTQLIPVQDNDAVLFGQRPQTSVLEDVEEFGAFDSQGLCIEGFHVDPLPEPSGCYLDDDLDGYYAEFEEEVLAEDGEVEEYFGYDRSALEEEGIESRGGDRYRRQQRRGYPPVTPNACAKDAMVSQLFDQAWGEVVLWLRDLLSLYSQKVLRDKPAFLADVVGSSDRVIESPLRPFSQSVLSRSYFPSQMRLKTSSSLNPPLDPSSLVSAIKIQSKPLNQRAPSASISHVLESREGTPYHPARPESSITVASRGTRSTVRIGGHSSDTFMQKRAVKGRNLPSLYRLTHLESGKPRTPSVADDVMGGIVQGKKLLTFSDKDRLPSPPHPVSNSPAPYVGRNFVLPPLKNNRASSAATDHSRQSQRERVKTFAESSRPNTSSATHSLKSEVHLRRMSTPSGQHVNQGGLYSRGQSRHATSPLTGITGVSMPISNHPATEANTASNNMPQYDGREISPVSDEEYDGFRSPGPSSHHSQRRNKLVHVPSIR